MKFLVVLAGFAFFAVCSAAAPAKVALADASDYPVGWNGGYGGAWGANQGWNGYPAWGANQNQARGWGNGNGWSNSWNRNGWGKDNAWDGGYSGFGNGWTGRAGRSWGAPGARADVAPGYTGWNAGYNGARTAWNNA